MKKVTLPLLLSLAIGVSAQAEERTFTDLKGRQIVAEIVSYEPSIDELTIKRSSDGKVFTFKGRRLSDADREYIKEWHKNDYAQSAVADATSRLFVKVQKKTGDTRYSNAGTRNATSRDKFYALKLTNSSDHRLDDYKVKYRIYARDGKGLERFRKGNFTVGISPDQELEIDTDSVTIRGVSKEKASRCSGGG